jgi:hypothetical protein
MMGESVGQQNGDVGDPSLAATPPSHPYRAGKIRPIVIYPFRQPDPTKDRSQIASLERLAKYLQELKSGDRFHKPRLIVNHQTVLRSEAPSTTKAFIGNLFGPRHSTESLCDINYVWAVDTCSMWQKGLGDAFNDADKHSDHNDIFWLIPGDFAYSSPEGESALHSMLSIPLGLSNSPGVDLCIGEIEVDPHSAKQLIDTYGTYGLMYNWFPDEAVTIRKMVSKPRSEFFAISMHLLRRSLIWNRWFAYEQTLMILLQYVTGAAPHIVKTVSLGRVVDPEEQRNSLLSAMTQVERTERALKLYWRERVLAQPALFHDWYDRFATLDRQSESIRTAATVILRRILKDA